jgi:hypothetical protein
MRDTQDASDMRDRAIDVFYDTAENLFASPGDHSRNVRAQSCGPQCDCAKTHVLAAVTHRAPRVDAPCRKNDPVDLGAFVAKTPTKAVERMRAERGIAFARLHGANVANNRWGLRGDYRFGPTKSKDDAPEFFGRETRYVHRVYVAIVINTVR